MSANLLTDTKIIRVLNAVAAGVTQQTSSIVDTAGFDGVMFVALLNTVTSGAVLSLQAQDNSLNQSGGMANVGNGATATLTDAGTNSNKTMILDIIAPGQRYVQCLLNRTTQNVTVDGMLAILYRGKGKPEAVDPSVALSFFGEATS